MTGHSYLEPISVFHLSYKNDIRGSYEPLTSSNRSLVRLQYFVINCYSALQCPVQVPTCLIGHYV